MAPDPPPRLGDSYSTLCARCGEQTVTIFSTEGWRECDAGTRRVFVAAQRLDLVTLEGKPVAGLTGDVTQTVIGWPLHWQTCQRTKTQ